MNYSKVLAGEFVDRPNRFIAHVRVDGVVEVVHVKNTGRCRELLLPGSRVYLAVSDNPSRKTKYDLIAVEKVSPSGKTLLINMDSQAPNDVAGEWLAQGGLFGVGNEIRREVRHGASRFDFAIDAAGHRHFLEVKGVTLERDGIALFPDAPTERGVKHLHELAGCVQAGYGAHVLFVVQMKGIREFRPNDAMHPAFGDALRQASQAGVKIWAMDCRVLPDNLELDAPVLVCL